MYQLLLRSTGSSRFLQRQIINQNKQKDHSRKFRENETIKSPLLLFISKLFMMESMHQKICLYSQHFFLVWAEYYIFHRIPTLYFAIICVGRKLLNPKNKDCIVILDIRYYEILISLSHSIVFDATRKRTCFAYSSTTWVDDQIKIRIRYRLMAAVVTIFYILPRKKDMDHFGFFCSECKCHTVSPRPAKRTTK